MSIIKMRGPIDVHFAFKIFSLPVPTRLGTRTFWQVPDPYRPEVKNLYPSDPADGGDDDRDEIIIWIMWSSFLYSTNQTLLAKLPYLSKLGTLNPRRSTT